MLASYDTVAAESRLKSPASLQVRPDHVLLRVVARAMVLWDSVLPTRAWLLEQLPPLIQVRRTHLARASQTCVPNAAA